MSVDLATIRAGWDHAARDDAMFYIITDASRAGGGWTADEFFAHGRREIDAMLEHVDRLGLVRHKRRALDFGCGIGRLTQALADDYERVDGVDISPEMVALAREHNQHGERCVYHANQTSNLHLFKDGVFDLVYSMIVLQHMSQTLQRGYVSEFFRVLAPGGVAVFEIPDGPDVGHSSWCLSMYGVARVTVEQWIEEIGGTLVDVEDLGQDSSWQNYRYAATA